MTTVNKLIYTFFAIIFCMLFLVTYIIFTEFNSSDLVINFLDIGQGDSILITTPQGRDIVIDGGPDNTLVYKLGEYLPFYDKSLDLLVLTHPDSDHLVGLVEILNRYQISNILLTGVYDDLPAYQEILKIVQNKKINILIAGEIKNVWVEPGLELEVLYPFSSLANKVFENNNDFSLVIKLKYKSFSALLTGDATKTIEEQLIYNQASIKSDVLKLGHHGSDTSSSEEFLKKVDPALAVILVGENRFGHPSFKVLKRLQNLSINYLTTQQQGDIRVITNGQGFTTDF